MQRVIPWGIGAAAAAILGGWLLGRDRPTAPEAAAPMLVPTAAAGAATEPLSVTTAPQPSPEQAPADPLAAYEDLLAVQSRISDFVQNADRMVAADRDRRAAELDALIDDLEERRMAVGAQGMYLRAAVAAAQFPGDAAARDAAVAALQQRYAGAAPSAAHLDARYRRLKAREQAIIRDANARAFFPNGMSREEFLRAELDAALREAYATSDD